jgi:hypothetical protein
MKKVLIASGVAVLAFAMIASAASFNTNLTVGSTGADVVALQTALMTAGYNIPAIAAGTPKGYFGSQTQTAVKAYQAARSIPSTGFVGPLTRAALNGGAMVTTPVAVGCPAGYTCTANVGTTPVVTTPGVITTPGMAGTLALTLQGSPSGATLDKGESEDIARYKLQASASDMQVTSLALDFDVRLWLYASSVVIKDDAGVVIASKSGLTQNDFIELTVGSSYRLYVPVSYVVPRAASKYFTVNVTMLPASDRCATTCTLTLSKVQVRSVDGTGVTDTQTDGTDRTFSFTGTNSGQLVTGVNANSPLKKLVQISNSNETAGVILGVFDLKSQNKDATLRTLKVFVKTDGTSVNTLFSHIKIKVNGQEYTANTIDTSSGSNSTASSTVTFTDLTIPLPKDVYVPVTITADVAKPSSTGALDGKSASTTLVANTTNIVAEDSTFNSVTVNAGTLISTDQIFSSTGAVISGLSATKGNVINGSVGGVSVGTKYETTYKFTLTAGDNALYVSAVPGVALGTTTTGYTNNTSTNASSTISTLTLLEAGVVPGDVAGSYYVIPQNGSRTFTWGGVMQYESANGNPKTHAISSVKYGTSSSNLIANTIDYGLETLKVTATF